MISQKTLIQLLNLENVSEDEQMRILEKVSDIVLDKALVRLMNELEEEEAKKLNELLDNGKQDEVAIFLYNKFPNINDIFDEEIEKIKGKLVQEYGK
ncbi:MAG: hypothetical protein PHG24_01165 [Candidatus Pacebacteria bacterium]|nr:hypothetical protein [Candidatus Paceibacterota bacterium]